MPGPRVNMQVVVKDSKKYAAIGGWGFGDFTEGKPADEAKHKTCFRCHEPAKDDWPRRVEQRLVGVRVELPRFESAAGREPRQGTDSQGEMPDTLSKATIQQVFAAVARSRPSEGCDRNGVEHGSIRFLITLVPKLFAVPCIPSSTRRRVP